MPKVANHIHRYKKVNLSKEGEYWVYKCQKPACSHYVPLRLALGRLCECNRCFEPMLIGKEQLSGSGGRPMAKPHCINCIEHRNTEDITKIASFLEENPDAKS